MTIHSPSSFGLIFLLIGYTAAGPEADPKPRVVRSSACQEHRNLHKRLDVVEKKVEDTVDKLDVELSALLEAIEAPEWRPLLDKPEQTPMDILKDPVQKN